MSLADSITELFSQGSAASKDAARELFAQFRAELAAGRVRAAEPDPASPTGWRVNVWVKQGILLGFRFGDVVDMGIGKGRLPFFDKDTLPLKPLDIANRVRLVPGGSSIRDGAYLGKGIICMPPMFINVGAYVGDGTLVDSHALVGSCAQIGQRVHLSAAAQIGGVIEPVGAMPVIVEDDVLVGGNCGVYEGAIIKRRAVLASGTIITGLDANLRSAERAHHQARAGTAAGRPRGRRGRARRATGDCRRRPRVGPVARHAGHREVSRREDRRSNRTRALDPVGARAMPSIPFRSRAAYRHRLHDRP